MPCSPLDVCHAINYNGCMTTRKGKPVKNNLVAKHARKFNKAVVHTDRKNDYKRKAKNATANKSEEE